MNVHIDIENIKDESPSDIDKIHKASNDFIKKLGQIANIEFLKIHVKKHKKAGPRIKYSIHTQLSSSLGLFESKSWGWDLITVAEDAINNLKTEFIKKSEKIKEHPKGRKGKESIMKLEKERA